MCCVEKEIKRLVTSAGVAHCCLIEHLPSINNHRSSSIDPTRNSFSSTRRESTFDCETERVFERQQRQERLANIRTTLTLFVVTATFILMYLPSIIITLFHIKPYEFREVLFLLYYSTILKRKTEMFLVTY